MSKLTTKFTTIIFVLFLAGCGINSKVTLKNVSSEKISNVRIYAAESLVWQGDIAAGSSVSASFNTDKDGGLRVTGNGSGSGSSIAFDTDYLGYTTPNDGVYHLITYQGKGVTSYDYSTQE